MPITVYFSKRNKDGRSLSLGDCQPIYNNDEASNKISIQQTDFVLHLKRSKSYEGEANNKLQGSNAVEPYEAKQSLKILKRELEAQLILNLVSRNKVSMKKRLEFLSAATKCTDSSNFIKAQAISKNIATSDFLGNGGSENTQEIKEQIEQSENNEQQHQLQNQFLDSIVQNNPVKLPKLKNQQMLDLVLALEFVHLEMGKNELYSMPSPSHPILVYKMLEWLSKLPIPMTKQNQIDSLQILQDLLDSKVHQTKTIMEVLTKEFYFINFLQQQLNNDNSNNQDKLIQSNSFNEYLGLIVDQIESSSKDSEEDLILYDFNLMQFQVKHKNQQSMIKHLSEVAEKSKLNNTFKLKLGFNMLVAQLRFKVINNKGDEIIIIVPFQTDQKTIIVEQLDEGVASSNDKINKKCYGHKIFNEEVNRHSEQNLIVALSLECDKVREIKQFENSIQQTSQFFQLLKIEFQQAGCLPFVRIENITLQIASSKQVCPTCRVFLNNPHSEIADDIQEFCINQQLILTKNPKSILYKSTVCIYTEDVMKGQAMKGQQQAEEYVKIDPKPKGLFSIDMIQARYFQSQCSPNLNYLKVPFKKMKLKHTIIFSGPKSYPKKYEQEDDAQLAIQYDTKSQQNQVKRKKTKTKAIYNSSKSGKIKQRRSQFDGEQNEDQSVRFVVEFTQSEGPPQVRQKEEQEIKSNDDSSVQSKVISKIIDLIEHMKVFKGQSVIQ